MVSRSFQRRAGAVVTAFAAMLAISGTAHADARTAGPKATGDETVIFTQAGTGAAFACNVSIPLIDSPDNPQQVAYRSVVICDQPLHMQGTSTVYIWGASTAFYYGTPYDNSNNVNTTMGRVNVQPGQWGVNSNVVFFTPAGYTATPGPGCSVPAAGQVLCTNPLGPIYIN